MIASAISQLWAAPFARTILHLQTLECAKVVHAFWAPSIQPDVHLPVSILVHKGLPPAAVWRLQPQGKIRYHD